jgi:valyl-tRNA synthetase
MLMSHSKLRVEQSRMAQDHQRQLEHVQKTAEANADRTRKRMEAEIADLQKHLSKVEADLAKVKMLEKAPPSMLTLRRRIKITS